VKAKKVDGNLVNSETVKVTDRSDPIYITSNGDSTSDASEFLDYRDRYIINE